MNIDKDNLSKIRKLLDELEELEDAIDVLNNYDAKAYAIFKTEHNNNKSYSKKVSIEMPNDILFAMKNYMANRISQIKEELEKM